MPDMRGEYKGQPVTIVEGEIDKEGYPLYIFVCEGQRMSAPVREITKITIDGIPQKWRDKDENSVRKAAGKKKPRVAGGAVAQVRHILDRSDY